MSPTIDPAKKIVEKLLSLGFVAYADTHEKTVILDPSDRNRRIPKKLADKAKKHAEELNNYLVNERRVNWVHVKFVHDCKILLDSPDLHIVTPVPGLREWCKVVLPNACEERKPALEYYLGTEDAEPPKSNVIENPLPEGW